MNVAKPQVFIEIQDVSNKFQLSALYLRYVTFDCKLFVMQMCMPCLCLVVNTLCNQTVKKMTASYEFSLKRYATCKVSWTKYVHATLVML